MLYTSSSAYTVRCSAHTLVIFGLEGCLFPPVSIRWSYWVYHFLCTWWDCCAPFVTWRTLSRSCLRLAPVCLNTRCQSADCICRCRWSHFNDLSLTAAGNDSSGIRRELNLSPSALKKPSEERSVLFKISPRLLSPMKIKSERETEMRKRKWQNWERGAARKRETEMRERPVQRHKRYSEREKATKIDRKCKNDSVC